MAGPLFGADEDELNQGDVATIYDAAVAYKNQETPLLVLAGTDYGMGSSRDWAAKGTFLLGVRAVIAESYERIHRSNLVGMGVLPLQFQAGETAQSLGLDGTETFIIHIDDNLQARQEIQVTAQTVDGDAIDFTVNCRRYTGSGLLSKRRYLAHRSRRMANDA